MEQEKRYDSVTELLLEYMPNFATSRAREVGMAGKLIAIEILKGFRKNLGQEELTEQEKQTMKEIDRRLNVQRQEEVRRRFFTHRVFGTA